MMFNTEKVLRILISANTWYCYSNFNTSQDNQFIQL